MTEVTKPRVAVLGNPLTQFLRCEVNQYPANTYNHRHNSLTVKHFGHNSERYTRNPVLIKFKEEENSQDQQYNPRSSYTFPTSIAKRSCTFTPDQELQPRS